MSIVQLQVVRDFAKSVGLKPDLLVMVVMMFFPLITSPIYLRLNSQKPRFIFDILVGTFILLGLYGFQASIHFYLVSVISIVLSLYAGPSAPKLVWVISFGYLGARHIVRYMSVSDETSREVDITGPMMVLVLKAISLSYTVGDQIATSKKRTSSMLELWGYFLHHSTVIVGPVTKLSEYQKYTSIKVGDVPSPVVPALLKLAQSVFWFGVYIRFSLFSTASTADIADPVFMSKLTMMERIGALTYRMIPFRGSFYGAWVLSEACLTLAGWGYDHTTSSWSLVANVRPFSVEFGQNPRESINNWNIRVSEWLREYVMEKVPNRNVGAFLSFLVSALWHGFSVTQYTMFVTLAIYLLVVAKSVRRAFHPLASTVFGGYLKPLYDYGGIVVHHTLFCFVTMPFFFERASDMLQAWNNFHYYGFVVCALAYGVSVVVAKLFPSSSGKAAKANKQQ